MRQPLRLLQVGVIQHDAIALLAVTICASLAMVGCGTTGGRPMAAASAKTDRATPPIIDTAKVVSQRLDVTVPLPGELQPFEEVRIFPKVTGFVQWIGVDRGSRVKRGALLATLVAPEIVAQKAEAQAKLLSAENQRIAGEAKLASDESTYQRLKVAAATPGVISDDELEVAEKTAEGDRARVVALRNTREAAQATLHSVEEIESYLRITAPFDGVISKRNVHPGTLVGPSGGAGAQSSMMRIEQVSHLRLIVAVPEAYVAGVEQGAKVNFTVPAYPGRTFTGTVARIAESMDAATRTMPVEMDVWNPDWQLHSGMFPNVIWPVRRPRPSLFVPQTALARTMETNFVIRVRDGKTEWVDVKPGATSGNLVEVFGGLHAGDAVALRASEELRPGTEVVARFAPPQVAQNLNAH
ncbi:MAG: efflux RND transporter periplasmic adaptor subunit [Terriglobia bacterium]